MEPASGASGMNQDSRNGYWHARHVSPPQTVHVSGPEQQSQFYPVGNGYGTGAIPSQQHYHPGYGPQQQAQYTNPPGIQNTMSTGNGGFVEEANLAPSIPLPGGDAMIPGLAKEQVGGRDWLDDPECPLNWPSGKKTTQMTIASLGCFVATIGTSLISPAQFQLIHDFGVTTTQSLLPVSLYTFALALGPVLSAPASETLGRVPVYIVSVVWAAFFTLGAGFSTTFAGICVCRFFSGLSLGALIVIVVGTISELYTPETRSLPAALGVLAAFFGPASGPVLGVFITTRQGWRWTQWIFIFMLVALLISYIGIKETYHPVIQRRLGKKRGDPLPPRPPVSTQIKLFATITILRPLQMLFTEPIVGFLCLYVGFCFGILYSFFAILPYVFTSVYHFSLEQSCLVFLSIGVGCVLGLATVGICNKRFYLTQVPNFPPNRVPPEYRLYPIMLGSITIPIGLFWFAWTARPNVSWASPVVAIIFFAWGNLCLFIGTMQYLADAYNTFTVASATSANSLSRFVFAGAFPLFIVQMYQRLGVDWATSLLAFISLLLTPIPWVLFRYGARIRARSRPEWTKEYAD